MSDCQRCNGVGYVAIIGDNDIECPVCKGTGEQQLPDIQVRFLLLYAGFPRMAYAPTLCNYDRRIAEQIVKHMGAKLDDEDREFLDSVEDEIQADEDKYPESYDETR